MTNKLLSTGYCILIVAAMIIAGCSRKKQDSKPDYSYVREYGYEYARIYRGLINKGSTEMEREAFLLKVQSKQYQLEQETNADIAAEFFKAFTDSAYIKL